MQVSTSVAMLRPCLLLVNATTQSKVNSRRQALCLSILKTFHLSPQVLNKDCTKSQFVSDIVFAELHFVINAKIW